MADKDEDRQDEQGPDEVQTTEQGYEIPVPTRKDFFGNLEKLAHDERGTPRG